MNVVVYIHYSENVCLIEIEYNKKQFRTCFNHFRGLIKKNRQLNDSIKYKLQNRNKNVFVWNEMWISFSIPGAN